jgi:hypothetical protein
MNLGRPQAAGVVLSALAAGLVLNRAVPVPCLGGTGPGRVAACHRPGRRVTAAELGLARTTMPAGRPCTRHPT